MDWENIDLNSAYELHQNFLDGYSFDTLILELTCNYKAEDITSELVMAHTRKQVILKAAEAVSIVENNVKNIVNAVNEYHKQS